MKKPQNLKGKVVIASEKPTKHKANLRYEDPYEQIEERESLTDSVFSNFENLNLTNSEKQKLSLSHRRMLNYFKHLNVFFLNQDAKKLVEEINSSQLDTIVIEAQMYGAYICLAALYSGRLSEHKRVEFIIENAPLALFPKSLIKQIPNYRMHKVSMVLSDDSWLSPFETLYSNDLIKCAVARSHSKKIA